MKIGTLRDELLAINVHPQVVGALKSAARMREYLKYAVIKEAFDSEAVAAAVPSDGEPESVPASPASKVAVQPGDIADFTPGLRASLAVARVLPGDISSDAPRSSADAMGAADDSW